MRTDEEGNPCPSTLSEYLKLCEAIAPKSKATAFLKKKIQEQGDDEVIAPDSQMRLLLFPMMAQPEE